MMARGEDEKYMALALRLAEKGRGMVSPNPMVGTVVVRNGKVVGMGYHAALGKPHAEVEALRGAGSKAMGSTTYLNLEPCYHWGRTPPCVEELIKAKVKEVVVAMRDPNPRVRGKGISKLRSAGIKVRVGILRKEAEKLNESFIKYITKGMPFVILKAALSLDGKIATKTGDSKWITGKEVRDYVHRLRSQVDGILVGINTILKDDPLLTVRRKKKEGRGKKPIRVIVDSQARIPLKARVLRSLDLNPTIIATTRNAPKKRIKTLEEKGAEVILMGKSKKVDLKGLMKKLGKREVSSLLIEGGGEIIASALKERIVDKILFFLAPKLIGGRDAITPIEGEGIKRLSEAIQLKDVEVKRFGEDLLIQGYVKYSGT